MSFPMLEVTSLACQQPLEEAGQGTSVSHGHGLPPVAGESPVRQAVYVIGEAAKRSRSAGMLGCGRVAPFNPRTVTCPNPAQRPRSSPRLTHCRHTRITPFPTQAQPSSDDIHTAGHVLERHPSLTAKLRSHDVMSQIQEVEGHVPSSSPSTVQNGSSHSTLCNTCEGKTHQWSGRYSVPTISIDPLSSSSSVSSTSHPVKTFFNYGKCNDILNLENSKYVTERIHNLVSAFSQRASRVKAHITQPPTPSTDFSEGAEDGQTKTVETRQPLDSLDEEGSISKGSEPMLVSLGGRQAWLRRHFHHLTTSCTFPHAFEPQSRLYICWLLVVSIFYVYNACVIPLRSVFRYYQTDDNLAWWVTADCLADLIYILDIVIFKSRVMYLDNGFWISSPSLMRRHYLKTTRFRYDLVSLLPLELFYLKFGPISVFRLPRLLKIHTFWEFFNRVDSVLSSPHAVRVMRTVLYMLFLIHLNTCAYYGFSKYEGIGINQWVFQGVGNAYIRCFYFATKTATSIGKNPKPQNKQEYVFMTCSWLMGVFVFALLIGQIRDIVATATRNQNEYRRVMDHTQAYLHRLNLPPTLQERVRLWFAYTWQSQKTLNEMKCLESLPKKMRTDIAISVHIQTLSKVQLFQDCDKALIRDLVLKLQPVLYLPGDFVCKKGEVGKEMYIVQSGQVLVMGGDKVLATLGEGSVFGEISLLALAGGNRRTANVRSRGFSSLFVLSKADLQATIKDYPEAQEILKKKAKKLIQQNEERERQQEPTDDDNVIIKSRESTPKLLHTVLQVVRPDSFTASVIRRSSRSMSHSSLPSPCPWTSSQASPFTSTSSSTSHDPARRRSSLEVPSGVGGHNVAKVSVSESLQEEEEEDEFVVVETCKEPASPTSSCHSRHTTVTLHHSLPSSPVPQPASPCMSTSSHEDVFESESQSENPLADWYSRSDVDCARRERRDGSSTSMSPPLISSQHIVEDLIQLSPKKESRIHKDTSDRCKESQRATGLQYAGQMSVPGEGGVEQAQGSVFSYGSVSNPSSAHSERSERWKLYAETPHQPPTRSYSLSAKSTTDRRERASNSGSCRDSGKGRTRAQTPDLIKLYHSHPDPQNHTPSREQSSYKSYKNETPVANTKLEKSHPYSRTPWDQSYKSYKNETPVTNTDLAKSHQCHSPTLRDQSSYKTHKQDETPVANTDLAKFPRCVSGGAINTEDLLIKFGLTHGSTSDRGFCSHSSGHDSRSSPVSYELFLTELSKTMPNPSDQVPILSSSSFSLNSSSSSWQHPPLLSPPPPHSQPMSSPSSLSHQISCSAIVHRECTPPDTSPFDAQESKL